MSGQRKTKLRLHQYSATVEYEGGQVYTARFKAKGYAEARHKAVKMSPRATVVGVRRFR